MFSLEHITIIFFKFTTVVPGLKDSRNSFYSRWHLNNGMQDNIMHYKTTYAYYGLLGPH